MIDHVSAGFKGGGGVGDLTPIPLEKKHNLT